ncbi:hypothetical protein CPB83DRAFT_888345 [Crepidotus variabilis]|uniref:Armadillo-like helical domain-containing protein n=1 Tax=Crepidotus variabilis TaxID=179855 RepID=A0A9P6EVD9_9AGAR|nr:hypothetical protein CPB83DRAFT_888345 [Crepidotus variabilis]
MLSFGRRATPQPSGLQITSKFASLYSKLLQGLSPSQITPSQSTDRFYADLLDLRVDRPFLTGELNKLSKDLCLGKPFLSEFFGICVQYIRTAEHEDIKKGHALDTLTVLLSSILAKNLSGWEVMDVLAGSVAQSDTVFKLFTETLDILIGDSSAPAPLRHQALQLALTYMCSVAQLSSGAYFLQRDFFPSLALLVKAPDTEQYTFEAILLLAILANYHKSDAAKLNLYLKRISDSTDGDFMRKLCWASNFTLQSSLTAYQDTQDDSAPTSIVSSLSSAMTRLRPDRILALSPLFSPSNQDKIKIQPVQATVVLLPVYEFLRGNPLFTTVLLEDLVAPAADTNQITSLPCTLISLSSYLFSHASSISTTRSLGYASLALNTLLSLVENGVVMQFMTQTTLPSIRLCRQKLPLLALPRSSEAPVCAILDCCVLWLRHNLQKRLEVQSYTICTWICFRIIWFLQSRRVRLNYNWTELWISLIGVLGFLSSKMDSLYTTGGVELLVSETIRLLDFALCTSEAYLPSPRAVHELIYELLRSADIFRKQSSLLKSLALPYTNSTRPFYGNDPIDDTLGHLLTVVEFYAERISVKGAGIGNPDDVMRIVADEIEANGIHDARELRESTPLTRSQDVLDFARIACGDVLALIP